MFSPSLFTSVIDAYLPEPHASLLNGIIFGVKLKTGSIFYQQIKIVGLLHLVVLSGINISMLAAIIGGITRFFGKLISILITILTVIIFIVFVGAQAPIIRAGVMGLLTLVGIISRRKTYPFLLLLLSLFFILIVWPQWFKSISLYLSYAATVGILLFGQTRSNNEIWKELKISLSAQLFTTPIIFICFKQISFIAPLSNLLVAPIIPPLMIFGFLTAFLGKINYLLGMVPAFICFGLLSYMVWVIETLSKLPFAFYQFK